MPEPISHNETVVNKKTEAPPREQATGAPKIDAKFQVDMGGFWGDVRKNFKAENPDQQADLDTFFENQQDRFRKLGSERTVAQIHQFHELDDYADGLPMLVDFMGAAKQRQRTGYDHLDEDFRKQTEAFDQRNKKLFLDTARRLFPEERLPTTYSEAHIEISRMSKMDSGFGEVLLTKSSLELFKDPSISLKRRIEILDDTMGTIGDMQGFNAFYGDMDLREAPQLGARNKQQAIEAARLMYRLNAVRDQYQKELYGREDVTAREAKKIDTTREEIHGGDQRADAKQARSGTMTPEEVEAARKRSEAEAQTIRSGPAKPAAATGEKRTEGTKEPPNEAAGKQEFEEDSKFSGIIQTLLEADIARQIADESRQTWGFSSNTALLKAIEKTTPQGQTSTKENAALLRDLITKQKAFEERIRNNQEELSEAEQFGLKIAQSRPELMPKTIEEIASRRVADSLRTRIGNAWENEVEIETQRVLTSQRKVKGDNMMLVAKPGFQAAFGLFLDDLRRKAAEAKTSV